MDSQIVSAWITATATIVTAIITGWFTLKVKEKEMDKENESGYPYTHQTKNRVSYQLWGIGGAIIGAIAMLTLLGFIGVLPNWPITPNTGNILFEENFEDGKADGFVIEGGNWRVTQESSGNRVYEANTKSDLIYANSGFGSKDWGNYVVEYRFKLVEAELDPSLSDFSQVYLLFRRNDNAYVITCNPDNLTFSFVPKRGDWDNLINSGLRLQRGIWYSIRIEANETDIKAFLNDDLRIHTNDTRLKTGNLSLNASLNTIVQFDDVRVTRLGNE